MEVVRTFDAKWGLVLLAKVLIVGVPAVSEDADILGKLDHFQEQGRDVRTEISMGCALCVV